MKSKWKQFRALFFFAKVKNVHQEMSLQRGIKANIGGGDRTFVNTTKCPHLAQQLKKKRNVIT
jgi:hypothetical protein